MTPLNLVCNTGYYGPDYTGLLYCALALFCLIWGVRGLYRIRRDKRHLAMKEATKSELEKLTAVRNHLDAVPKGGDHEVYPWDLNPISLNNLMRSLYRILDSEGHKICANCGVYTDNFCIIEKGPPEENWIEDIWVKMGMLGKPICGECYYQ